MTGGVAVILGKIGDNFAAGMTGGMAFVYDEEDEFEPHVNEESVVYQRIGSSYWEGVLKDLLMEHAQETQSAFAQRLLTDWDLELPKFWQVCPKEMVDRLEQPLSEEPEAKTA